MSYNNGSPNGELYIGNVKWSNDYQITMLFDNTSARDSFMQSQLSKIKTNVIYYNKNGYIDVDSNIKGMSGYNYVYFKCDSDISNYWYCCFITDYDYIAPKTTRIYVEIDVIQTYLYSTTFYRSLINRAHIRSDDDDYRRYTLAEPCFNAASLYDYNIGTFGTLTDWTPKWYCELMSNRIDLHIPPSLNEFSCGWGSGESATSICGFYASPLTSLTNIVVDFYNCNEPIGNHKDEILGLKANPSWSMSDVTSPSMMAINGNEIKSTTKSLSYNVNTLPNGYTPKNKKLLSSAFRVLILNNRNGYNLRIKPELITANQGTISITLQKLLVGSAQILIKLNNYRDFVKSISSIPYNAQLPILYDTNTGTNKAMNIISGVTGVVGSAVNFGTSVASLGAGITANPTASAQTNAINYGTTRAGQVSGAIGSIGGLAESTLNLISAFDSKLDTIGSGGDNISVYPDMVILRLYDSCPSEEECIMADDFLSTYGYRLDEIGSVRSYLNTRSNWNYIKTSNINLTAPAPTSYINTLKNIFNNGITFWHNYNTFGDYSQANN